MNYYDKPEPVRGAFKLEEVKRDWRKVCTYARVIGFDTETWRIENGVMPKPVCYTFFELGKGQPEIYNDVDGNAHLKKLLLDDSVHIIAQNAAFDFTVASQFDRSVMALAARAYRKGRIHCTKIRQIMLTCADTWNDGTMDYFVGGLSGKAASINALDGMVKFYFDLDISASKTGAGAWRTRYRELDGIPVDLWDREARDYAMSDAVYAATVFIAQEATAQDLNKRLRKYAPHVDVLGDSMRQAYSAFVLNYMSSSCGIKVDEGRVANARKAAVELHNKIIPEAIKFGMYVSSPKDNRKVKMQRGVHRKLFARAMDLLHRNNDPIHFSSKTQQVSTSQQSREALFKEIEYALVANMTARGKVLTPLAIQELAVIHNLLRMCADADKLWKEVSTFISAVEGGCLNPDNRLRYSMQGLVATGRTSSSKPNLQNLPRNGAVRSCIEPDEGYVFLICDYSAAEFRTLGQINEDEAGKGSSEIARQYRLNRHFDPHLYAAAKMWEIENRKTLPFEEAVKIYADDKHALYKDLKKKRQLAKILNFGLAGGLTEAGFVTYARGYGVELTLEESSNLVSTWTAVWTEMAGYFERRKMKYHRNGFGSDFSDPDDDTRVYVFARDNRARFCESFTVACNTPFQGMAASGIKEAMLNIFEECFFKKSSPLFGSYPVLMVHDEIVLETPNKDIEHVRRAAARFSELMVAGMEKFTPDVPAEADVAVSTRWTKDAKAARDEDGKLLIWEPTKEDEVDDDEDHVPVDLEATFPLGYASLRAYFTASTPDEEDEGDDDDDE